MKILVAIDLQNDFTTGALGNAECSDAAENAVAEIERFKSENGENGRIYATLDTHYENYISSREGQALPVVHCIKDTWGHAIDPRVKAALGDDFTAVEKTTFGSKDLPRVIANDIKTEEIEEIELIGVCTDICVISNAMILRAFFPETPISIKASCCGGVTPESHSNALEAMKMCQFIINN